MFLVVGCSAHPREHVKRIEDGKLISPKYRHLFGRDSVTSATKKGERPPFSRSGVNAGQSDVPLHDAAPWPRVCSLN